MRNENRNLKNYNWINKDLYIILNIYTDTFKINTYIIVIFTIIMNFNLNIFNDKYKRLVFICSLSIYSAMLYIEIALNYDKIITCVYIGLGFFAFIVIPLVFANYKDKCDVKI